VSERQAGASKGEVVAKQGSEAADANGGQPPVNAAAESALQPRELSPPPYEALSSLAPDQVQVEEAGVEAGLEARVEAAAKAVAAVQAAVGMQDEKEEVVVDEEVSVVKKEQEEKVVAPMDFGAMELSDDSEDEEEAEGVSLHAGPEAAKADAIDATVSVVKGVLDDLRQVLNGAYFGMGY